MITFLRRLKALWRNAMSITMRRGDLIKEVAETPLVGGAQLDGQRSPQIHNYNGRMIDFTDRRRCCRRRSTEFGPHNNYNWAKTILRMMEGGRRRQRWFCHNKNSNETEMNNQLWGSSKIVIARQRSIIMLLCPTRDRNNYSNMAGK